MPIASARLLVRPLARVLGWRVLLSSVVVAMVLVWWLGRGTEAGPGGTVFVLRLGALCLAAGMAFVLDDPTEDTTGNTPVSLLLRRVVRIALALPGMLLVWPVLVRIANGSPSMTIEIPSWPFGLEPLAFSAIALAGAAVSSRRLSDRLGGPAGAITPLVAAAVVALPGRFNLWDRIPGTSEYASTTRWWFAILIAAMGVLVTSSRVGAPPLTRAKPTGLGGLRS